MDVLPMRIALRSKGDMHTGESNYAMRGQMTIKTELAHQ
jgi:hypothetical protein